MGRPVFSLDIVGARSTVSTWDAELSVGVGWPTLSDVCSDQRPEQDGKPLVCPVEAWRGPW